MINDKKGVIFALISSVTFGLITLFTIPIIKEGVLNSTSILFYRFLFATIGVAATLLIKRERFVLTVKDIPKIGILGCFYAATALFLLFAYTIEPHESGILTAVHYLYPIAVMIIMVSFFKAAISFKVILSAVMAIAGVTMLCVKMGSKIDFTTIKAISFVILSVITYAIYIVGTNKIGLSKIPSLLLTFYILFAGVIVVGIYGMIRGDLMLLNSGTAAINIALLAMICTVISNLTLILAVKRIGSTTTSILGSLEPLVAVIVGLFIFNEHLNLSAYIGIALIILSVVIAINNSKKMKG